MPAFSRYAGASSTFIDDSRAACNVNITPPGGQYLWHYDRNLVTAVIYLNEVGGGETELYPNRRVLFPAGSLAALQPVVDKLILSATARTRIRGPMTVTPTTGAMLVPPRQPNAAQRPAGAWQTATGHHRSGVRSTGCPQHPPGPGRVPVYDRARSSQVIYFLLPLRPFRKRAGTRCGKLRRQHRERGRDAGIGAQESGCSGGDPPL